ncbi:MAG: aminodeoxychorismate synthase component I [Sterolibacteriaceae bacterium]|nr:aminodeoxychorismate synthase component I [Candidatus Methylophosphatis haderslevensis]
MRLVFDFADANGLRTRQVFSDPREIVVAHAIDEVRPALRRIEAARRAGQYAAGLVSYEAAPAFDSACKTRPAGPLPLLCFGIFDRLADDAWRRAAGSFARPDWQLDTGEADFCADVETIRDAIRRGDTYQVNYTIRGNARLDGDDFAYYEQLRLAQASDYCAYLDLGRFRLLSASPELFFRWETQVADCQGGGLLTTRPMKGTAPRGRWAEEDAAIADALYASEKNRAENVMIVDLLRNDLSRLSAPGGVSVPQLFSIERYPTLFQMTSTITARTRPQVTLDAVFAALFPCGSVTGAPKIKAMEIIAGLERTPRGAYCGAIGLVGPQGAVFNVPIRTVTLDTDDRSMVCGLGSGITWSSDAQEEHAEVITKSHFLTREPEHFELFETLLLQDAVYTLRARHLTRLTRSAEALGFAYEREALDRALYAFAAAHPAGRHRVRLLLAKMGAERVEGTALPERDPAQVTVAMALAPVARNNRFLFHKTTQRACYDAHTAAHPDAFDVLLWNEDGELTEFTRGNLVVELDGQRLTPPIACGLLPGTLRAELLAQGEIVERVIHKSDLARAQKVWFINSVRGWLQTQFAAPGRQPEPQAGNEVDSK